MNKLEFIQFSSVNDPRSVKCFIEVRNYFFNVKNIRSFYKVFDSMGKCLPNIPEKKFHHAIVECALNEIRKKASELGKRNFLTIVKKCNNLIHMILILNDAYLVKNTIDNSLYQIKCLKLVNEIKPILNKHGGFKQILANLTLIILTGGAGFLVLSA